LGPLLEGVGGFEQCPLLGKALSQLRKAVKKRGRSPNLFKTVFVWLCCPFDSLESVFWAPFSGGEGKGCAPLLGENLWKGLRNNKKKVGRSPNLK